MDFIKTKSSYVKQTKHSQVNDGSIIYERDASTIGGLNLLSSTQYPIYTSGNFIISIDDSTPIKRKITTAKWESNGDSDIWTLDNLPIEAATDSSADEASITLNRDFFKLQDFAYYGSLSDLIQASFNDIVTTFYGELYASLAEGEGYNVYYHYNGFLSGNTETSYNELQLGVDYVENNVSKKYDDATFCHLVSNPFSLNAHITNPSNNIEDLSKYLFANDNWENYYLITSGGTWSKLSEAPTVVMSEKAKAVEEDTSKRTKLCIGDELCTITFTAENGETFPMKAFIGDEHVVYYLTQKAYLGKHIRPSEELYNGWYNDRDLFQTYLLTRHEDAMSNRIYYGCTFEVMTEVEDGYINELRDFTIPVDDGGYNIDIYSADYSRTVTTLSQIAAYYDEHFTDNLYRSMTHEAIKNFDWTFTRVYQEGEEEEYVIGGNRISNIIHLFGREFDEIKSYIDAIRYINVVTYDNKNNLPDYFLSDLVDIKGWDLTHISPFSLTEYVLIPLSGKCEEYKKYFITSADTAITVTESANTVDSGETTFHLNRLFSQDLNYNTVQPFYPSNSIPYGTFMDWKKNLAYSESEHAEIYNNCFNRRLHHDDCTISTRIMPYYDKKEYTVNEIYNEFLRRLALNSPHIFKHKGTIEGIETILAMFGLKSQRWIDALHNPQKRTVVKSFNADCTNEPSRENNAIEKEDYYTSADYEIIEYTSFSNPLLDEYYDDKDMTWINWYNSTKLISYDSYTNYEGLPVIGYSVLNKDNDSALVNANVVYPYFGKEIDGDPYYQMNGGWLNKTNYIFDKDNNILLEGEGQYGTLFTETHAVARSVDDISDIKYFTSDELHNGDTMYVEDFKDYVIIDGFDFYPIESERLYIEAEDDYILYKYFEYTVKPTQTKIGNLTFSNVLSVSNPLYPYNDNLMRIDMDELQAEQTVKVYISGSVESGLTFTMTDGVSELSPEMNRHIMYFIDDRFIKYQELLPSEDASYIPMITSGKTNFSHYFILHDINSCNYYDFENGWEQLLDDDERYYKINAVIEKNIANNPHSGHFIYDNGCEYIKYFKNIFKYAYEEDLINEDCFDDDLYNEHLEVISSIGFSELMPHEEDGTICPIKYVECKDTKIHSFMDLIQNSGSTTDLIYKSYGTDYHLSDVVRYETPSTSSFKYCTNDESDYIGVSSGFTNVNDNIIISGLSSTDVYKYDDATRAKQLIHGVNEIPLSNGYTSRDITHQIINTKRIDIKFNMHNEKFTQDDLKERKYIDDVIMPYVEQMLPSNIICKVDYIYS